MRGVTNVSKALSLAAAGILAVFIDLNLPRGPAEAISSQTQPASVSDTHSVAKAQVQKAYGKLPLSFEVNQGQVTSEVKFLSHCQGYSLFLTSTEAVLALRPTPQNDARTGKWGQSPLIPLATQESGL